MNDVSAYTVMAAQSYFDSVDAIRRDDQHADKLPVLDIDESEVGPINVQVRPPDEVVGLLDELHHSVSVAEEASAAAARARREAAKLLSDAGFPMRDIGQLLGVSHQRISQILSQ